MTKAEARAILDRMKRAHEGLIDIHRDPAYGDALKEMDPSRKCRCGNDNAIHYIGGGQWACFKCWLRVAVCLR